MLRNLFFTFSFFLSLALNSQDVVGLADKMTKSTLRITDSYTSFVGSGFICEGSDYIITNYHVVKDMNRIYVNFYQKDDLYECKIKIYDKDLDLAILSLNKKPSSLSNKKLSISDNKIKIGSNSYASGYPYGTYQFSSGNISGRVESEGINYIQHTSPISSGNSGGPLVNEKGDVIGINTFILREAENMGYAIPIYHVEQLLIECGVKINHLSHLDIRDNSSKDYSEDISSVNYTQVEQKVINHQKDDKLMNNLSFLDYFYGFLLLCVFLIFLYLIFVE